jgi:hypothetical protein
MKKTFLTLMIFAFLANVSAQLKVDATGRVGIGTANPQYKLDVEGDIHVDGNIYLESDSNLIVTTNNVPLQFKVNGVLAGSTGSSGRYNVSFGYRALPSVTSGSYNTANGHSALYSNTTGYYNTVNGANALYSNTTGMENAAIGESALISNTTGSYNTAIGNLALTDNTTGSYNTAVGFGAGVSGSLTNATAIGSSAMATSSYQVRIGDTDVTSIGGYAAWTNFADGRAKKNVRTGVPGLAFINRLQPVTFNLDLDAIDGLLNIDKTKKYGRDTLNQALIDIDKKAREAKEKQVQTGFIAQDVEKIAKSIGYNFSGVDVDETGIYGLRYAEFVVPLVKAVQELSEQNDRLQTQVNELAGLVYSLLAKDADSNLLRSGNAAKSTTGLQDVLNSGAYLQQNSPNPFNQSTQIRYYLPATIKTAWLCIYDLQGVQLKQTVIQERGEGVQVLYGSELKAGIYLYSLIADGQEVDTKRMILTK